MTRAFSALASGGLRLWAPPMQDLLNTTTAVGLVPSNMARAARAAGLQFTTWGAERSGHLWRVNLKTDIEERYDEFCIDRTCTEPVPYFYQGLEDTVDSEGDLLEVVHALTSKVGARAISADNPEAVSFYAQCVIPIGTRCARSDGVGYAAIDPPAMLSKWKDTGRGCLGGMRCVCEEFAAVEPPAEDACTCRL